MEHFFTLLKDGEFNTALILVCLIVIGITTPLAMKWAVSSSIQAENEKLYELIIDRHIVPMGIEIKEIKEFQEIIKIDIKDIKDMSVSEIVERSIAAYTKIFTIDDLEENPTNRVNIKKALMLPQARAILFELDRDRTLIFEKYFSGS